MRYPIKKTRLYKRFFSVLAPVVDWKWSRYVSEEENLRAKAALREFLHRAYLLLPKAKRYNFEPLGVSSGGTEFLRRTLAVKRNLDQQRWDNACHELYDVLYFHSIEDRRILYTIIALLEGYL